MKPEKFLHREGCWRIRHISGYGTEGCEGGSGLVCCHGEGQAIADVPAQGIMALEAGQLLPSEKEADLMANEDMLMFLGCGVPSREVHTFSPG